MHSIGVDHKSRFEWRSDGSAEWLKPTAAIFAAVWRLRLIPGFAGVGIMWNRKLTMIVIGPSVSILDIGKCFEMYTSKDEEITTLFKNFLLEGTPVKGKIWSPPNDWVLVEANMSSWHTVCGTCRLSTHMFCRMEVKYNVQSAFPRDHQNDNYPRGVTDIQAWIRGFTLKSYRLSTPNTNSGELLRGTLASALTGLAAGGSMLFSVK